jgi:MFS family permease
VLGERNFRLFFTGYITSLVGSAMVPVALTFAVLDQGDGTAAVGYVLGAETVPLVALLLLGGVVGDRFPRRVSMLGADLIRFASEGLLAVLLLTGSAPLWIVMVLAAVLGAGQAFFNPAMTGLMPEMVSAGRLQSANALRGVASSIGQVLGPGLAGIIVAIGGAGWAIAIDSATYAVSAACLLRLDIPPRPRPGRPRCWPSSPEDGTSSAPAPGYGSSWPSSPPSTRSVSPPSWFSAPAPPATASAVPGPGGSSWPPSAPAASSAGSSPCARTPADPW